ncbi:ABC transporter substrate-binding protein [Burkholderia plantarii]|uniref:heme/hemin ABC transporter substrate-binding protein n=1 Tax=Burkholderia plantarii TaxID=41899 RepID=UPI0027299D0C|nr:helical backbone metal receptor [Burkholderia plantarii]WLE57750.1 ABC transporter substrate-binding protein [Burkholderia plantarii]
MSRDPSDVGRRRWLRESTALVLGVTVAAWGLRAAAASINPGSASASAGAAAGASAGAPAAVPPGRVVVIGGALGEIVYALGCEGRLVGTDTTCTFPPAVRALPKIGYQRTVSAESLLALRPDLVLASAEAGPPTALDQVRQAGVRVELFAERHDPSSTRDKITGMAAALGAQAAGRALAAKFDHDWARAMATAAPPPLRVLFVMDPVGRQPMVAGRHTGADAMLHYAGVTNVIGDADGYKVLTSEALVAAQPDVVLTTDDTLQAVGGPARLLATAGFSLTPAGRASRVVSLDSLFLLGFGPRMPEAVIALRRRLAAA